MEIVFVASEMVPFASTGGLGEVMGSLPKEIARLGYDVSVFLPKYKKISERDFPIKSTGEVIHIPVGSEIETAEIFSMRYGEFTLFLIGHSEFFDREELYGTPIGDYPDNDRRF